ncbi:MAG: hypothetical protein AVDCRST_MAG48-1490 [uncultured Friedmanniella sp.]|uniref:DUF1579 domain-containing protein n=1 Tax=uncultured Friedmanniella sp. TaxID=335381 RepID=A0A6J4KDY4_9ACTN|nr:MAG: hypothetical protein AVDCRST_MAG48-1490 [uncultured Friedmanniella sp.]
MDLTARSLPLLGTWTGLERRTAADGGTTSARASLVLRLDVGGTAVVADYRSVQEDGAELTAHAVLRVTGPDQVTGWLFDSAGGAPDVLTGHLDQAGLELYGHGRRHRVRGAGDTLEQEVARSADDGWRPRLEGRYRRLSGH